MIEAMMMAAGSKEKPLYVEDVFSTYLYTGTGSGSIQTINNGIDLAGEGGLVWTKGRDVTLGPYLNDTERGIQYDLISSSIEAQSDSGGSSISSVNNTGYELGFWSGWNQSGGSYVSWTFRKAPRFFDIVKFTGDGTSGRRIAHDLGIAPGVIFIKQTDSSSDWSVFVWGGSSSYISLSLNKADGTATIGNENPNTENDWLTNVIRPSGSADGTATNKAGSEYVAYLFAHDPSEEGIIQCGSYTGNGSTSGPVIDLGWEPQYLIIKRIEAIGNWFIWDSARNSGNPRNSTLQANRSDVESSNNTEYNIDFLQTGFQIRTSFGGINYSNEKYIYMAIRAPEPE